MKETVRCYKCGREFETDAGVRSDICPGCMSFVDVPLAREAYRKAHGAAGEAAPERRDLSAAVGRESLAPEKEAPSVNSALSRAEKLLEAGVWSVAREEFAAALLQEECWQAHWGIVRAATRELSDLSSFFSVREHADAALDKMPAQERRQAGARYLPQLNEMRRRTAEALKTAENVAPPPKEVTVEKKSSSLFAAAGVLFFILLFVSVTLLGTAGGNRGLTIAGGLMLGLSALFLVFVILLAIRRSMKIARVKKVAETVADSRQRQYQKDLNRLRQKLDDVDFLCGYLKY